MAGWTKFAKSIYNLKKGGEVHIYRANKNDKYVSKFEKVTSLPMSGVGGWPTLTKNGSANDAGYLHRFCQNSNLTAASLYNSMFTIYTKDAWEKQYQAYADRYLNK